jgi:hypothetical protein
MGIHGGASPSSVLDDMLDGKITALYAEREYGVVVDAGGRQIDEAATALLRSSAAQQATKTTAAEALATVLRLSWAATGGLLSGKKILSCGLAVKSR